MSVFKIVVLDRPGERTETEVDVTLALFTQPYPTSQGDFEWSVSLTGDASHHGKPAILGNGETLEEALRNAATYLGTK